MESSLIISLDFSKVFDKVSHHHLFHKLHYYMAFVEIYIKLDFTLNRSQCVIVDGQQSDWTGVLSGVPQGFTPLLFLCFINDLPNRVTSKIKLYADDMLLSAHKMTVTDYNSTLNTLEQWEADWKMSFN